MNDPTANAVNQTAADAAAMVGPAARAQGAAKCPLARRLDGQGGDLSCHTGRASCGGAPRLVFLPSSDCGPAAE